MIKLNKKRIGYLVAVIIAFPIIAFFFLLLFTHYQPYKKYSKYCYETNLEKYEIGVNGLVDLILNHEESWVRYFAAYELGLFSLNETKGTREILLETAVPGLIQGIRNEKDDDGAKSAMVEALDWIKPEEEIVIPVYIEILEGEPRGSTLRSVHALGHIGFDFTPFVPSMVKWLESEDPFTRRYAKGSLRIIGRYAEEAIEELERILIDDHFTPDQAAAHTALVRMLKDIQKGLYE